MDIACSINELQVVDEVAADITEARVVNRGYRELDTAQMIPVLFRLGAFELVLAGGEKITEDVERDDTFNHVVRLGGGRQSLCNKFVHDGTIARDSSHATGTSAPCLSRIHPRAPFQNSSSIFSSMQHHDNHTLISFPVRSRRNEKRHEKLARKGKPWVVDLLSTWTMPASFMQWRS